MGTKGHVTWACTHIGRDRQSWAGSKTNVATPPFFLLLPFFSRDLPKRKGTKQTKREKKKRKTFKRRQHRFTRKESRIESLRRRGIDTPPLHTHLSCLNVHLPSDHPPSPPHQPLVYFHIRSLLGRFRAVDHIQLRRWQQFCPWSFIVCHCVLFLNPCHVRETRLSLSRTLKTLLPYITRVIVIAKRI